MAGATLRNELSESFQPNRAVETVGKSVSLTCLNEAIDASGVPAKALAVEIGVSEGEFSKLRAGRWRLEQIDLLRPEIRADWEMRVESMRAAAGASREELILARLAHAAIDALALTKRRMLKAGL